MMYLSTMTMTMTNTIVIIYVLLLLQNTLQSNALPNDTLSFNFTTTSGTTYKVNVIYLGKEDHYYISDSYLFYPPKIRVDCECWCKGLNGQIRIYDKFFITQQQSNLTTTWNTIEKKTTGRNVCPFYVSLKCHVSFSIPNSEAQKYYALNIQYPVSINRLGFQILHETINRTEYFELNIPYGIENILVTEDIYMRFETPNENLSPTIPFQWCFVETENINAKQELIMYVPNDRGINEKGESSFTKLGWFQAPENIKLPFLSKAFFERHLNIKSKTCDAFQSSIDWNLNDIPFFYNSNGTLQDHGGRPISELNSDLSPNVALNFHYKLLIVSKKLLPKVKITLLPRVKNHINFNVSIYKNQKMEPESFDLYLIISFNDDNDFYYADIGIENSFYGIKTFDLNKGTRSSQNPFSRRVKLPENLVLNDPEWICVYNVNEMRQKLCKTVTIEDERNVEFSTCAENTTSIFQVSAMSVSDSRLIIIILSVSVVAVFVCALLLLWLLKKTKKKGTNCKDFPNQVDINMDENDETAILLNPISTNTPIQKNLRDKYKAIQWFSNEGYTDYGLVEDPTSPQLDSKKALKLEDMFQDDKQPRRILIKGAIGYGKTTLSRKLAYDWALNESYLQKFNFAILIHLSDLTTGLKDAVIARLRCEGISVNRIVRDLERNLSSVLLVLDGYDELKHDLNSEVNDLIRKKFYSEMTVIVTCHTEWSRLETSVKTNLRIFSSSNDSHVWDKIYVLSGIHNDKKKSGKHGDILITPLIANMLKQISNSATETEGIKNLEQLYKKFFIHLIKIHDCQKDDDTRLKELGKIACAKLSTRQFNFTNKEVSNNSQLSLLRENGIISKKLSDGCNQSVSYSIIHKSFLEFLAAFYLCSLFHPNESITLEKEIKDNALMPFCYRGNSMLFSFLTGLLNARQVFYLEFLQMDTYKFHFVPHMLVKHLLHCELSETLLRDLNTFIPSVWAIPWFQNDSNREFKLHDFVLKYGLKQEIINTVKWDPNYNISFEENSHIDKFELDFQNSNSESGANKYFLKSMTCSELICSFTITNEKKLKDYWQFLKTIIKEIRFNRLVLKIWFCVTTVLQFFYANNFINNLKLKVTDLQCRINVGKPDEFKSLTDFIKKFDLKTLSIELIGNPSFSKITTGDFQNTSGYKINCNTNLTRKQSDFCNDIERVLKIVASKKITKLIIKNFTEKHFCVDLNHLDCKSKQYELLWFEGFDVKCNDNYKRFDDTKNSYSYIPTSDKLVLEEGFKNIAALFCDVGQLFEETHKKQSMILFEQLNEFGTTLGTGEYRAEYFDLIGQMKNLQILSFVFVESDAWNSASVARDFEHMFESSPIQCVLFFNVKENHELFYPLLESIRKLKVKRMTNLNRLQVHFDLNQVIDWKGQQLFEKLLQKLSVFAKIISNVSFVSQDLTSALSDVFLVYQTMDEFAASNQIIFKHDFEGSKKDDSVLAKTLYDINECYHRFTMENENSVN